MHLMPLPFPRRKRNRSATANSLAAKIVTSQPRSRRVEGHRKNGNARLLFIYRFASSSVNWLQSACFRRWYVYHHACGMADHRPAQK